MLSEKRNYFLRFNIFDWLFFYSLKFWVHKTRIFNPVKNVKSHKPPKLILKKNPIKNVKENKPNPDLNYIDR